MDIFNSLGTNALIFMIPGILTQVGLGLKNKDDNSIGNDDAAGNVVLALAPVVPALLTGNQPIVKRSLWAAYNAIGGYLGRPVVDPANT